MASTRLTKQDASLVKETKALIKQVETGDPLRAGWLAIQDRVKRLAEGRTQAEVGKELGKSQDWVGSILRWDHRGQYDSPHQVREATRTSSPAQRMAKKVARDDPDFIAKIIAEAPPKAQRKIISKAVADAPPAAQRKIADDIAASPSTEPSLSKAIKPDRTPRRQKDPEDKLSQAVFALWEVGEILMDQAPDGESKVRMTALAEKAQRLSVGIVHLLGTGELEKEFRELLEEVGADV